MIEIPPLPEVETLAVRVDSCTEEAASDAADSMGDGEPVPSDGVIVTRDSGG